MSPAMVAGASSTLWEIGDIMKPVEAAEAMPTKRGPYKNGQSLTGKLNARRLALSLSVVGAIVAPVVTGSLMRFTKHPSVTVYERHETEAQSQCKYAKIFEETYPDSVNIDIATATSTICDKAQSDPTPTESHYTTLDTDKAFYVVRDIAIGLVAPAFLVLVFPRIFRRYMRWVTS